MEKVLNKLHELLDYDIAKPVKDYLDSRINKDVQELVKFGYFPNSSLIHDLLLSDISLKTLVDEKLAYVKHIENNVSSQDVVVPFFENHPLIIPYYDVYGELIALVGRTMLSGQQQKELQIPKYKNTIFKKGQHLFGLNWAKEEIIKKNHVYLVEGQIDIFAGFEKGLNNIVAVGSSSLSELQLTLLLRYTDNISVLFDNDEAGKKGYQLILEKFGKLANFQKVELPPHYKDLDEYLHDVESIL